LRILRREEQARELESQAQDQFSDQSSRCPNGDMMIEQC
jgi:hypothetical protein